MGVAVRYPINGMGMIKQSDIAVMPNEHYQQYHFKCIIYIIAYDGLKFSQLLLLEQQKQLFVLNYILKYLYIVMAL